MLLPSFRSLKPASLLLAALTAAALPAFAGDTYTATSSKDKNPVIEKPMEEPRFWIDLSAGGEFDIHASKFISNGEAGFGTALPTASLSAPAITLSNTLPAQIESRDFISSHNAGVINGRLEIGYKILPFLSVFVGGTYSHSGGDSERPVGSVTDAAGAFGAVGTRYDLFAGVGQYQAFAGMTGIKLNTPRTILDLLHIPKAIKPYASLSVGGKYVDDQYIRFYNGNQYGVGQGAIVDTGRLQLYHASWVITSEAELGYELELTRSFSVTFESGYGYDTRPEPGAMSGEIFGANRGGNRLYSTVGLGAKFSF